MYLINEDETFGQYITRIRYLKGLTQRKLAQISGLSNTTISRIEKGETTKPDLPTLRLLAKHLDIDERYILNASGYMPEDKPLVSDKGNSYTVFPLERPIVENKPIEPAVEKKELPVETDVPALKGVRLITLRLKKNITQKELGDILGVDKSTVCQYENQIIKPDMDMLNNIAAFFGVSIDYLTGKTDNPNDASWKHQSTAIPKIPPILQQAKLFSATPPDITKIKPEYMELAKELQDCQISVEDVKTLISIIIKNRS